MLHPLPLPLSSCLGCIPPLIGLPSLRFYAVGSSLFLLSCVFLFMFSILSRRCPLLATSCPSFSVCFPCSSPIPDLVWFRLSCDHGWIRSGSVNVRKQQQQQQSSRVHNVPAQQKRIIRSNISIILWYLYNARYFQHAHFIPILGVGKERRILIGPC